MTPSDADVDRLRTALAAVEQRAGSLPWAAERRWRTATHVGRLEGVPAVDLHDLSVALAVRATDAALEVELDAGEVLLVTGRGRGSGGVSPLRDAVRGRCAEIAAGRGWRVVPEGPGRVRVVVDPARASRRGMGLLFWLLVALLAAGVLALLLG